MLAGIHPFTGATVSEVRMAILDGRVTPLQAHLPDAPPTLRQFFDKELACDPSSRPNPHCSVCRASSGIFSLR